MINNKILIVDDENSILNALKRTFIDTDNILFFCNSAKQALEILKKNKPAVLLTDMKMPEINGMQLILEAKKNDPDIIPIILTGYSEKIDPTHKDIIWKYLSKPWNNQELIKTIQDAIKTYNKIEEIPNSQNTQPKKELTFTQKIFHETQNNTSNKTIIIVDDDQHILNAIKRILIDEPYNLKFCISPEQALNFLKTIEPSIIIADEKMEELAGSKLLLKAKQIYPNIKTILTTGDTSPEIEKKIKTCKIDAFIPKPWNKSRFKETLENL